MKCAAAGVLRACATIADDMSSKLNYVLSSGYLGRIDSPWSERLLCHQFVYKHMRLPLDGMKWEGENGRGGRTGWALAACRDRHEDSIACEMFRSQGGAPSAVSFLLIILTSALTKRTARSYPVRILIPVIVIIVHQGLI